VNKKSKKTKDDMKRDNSFKGHDVSAKFKNNFFSAKNANSHSFQNRGMNDFNDIMNKGGVSDINVKKQMLINKIKNNEIDPEKYMKFVDAMSNNEPDEEASEMSKKVNKKKSPYVAVSGPQNPVPVVNVNYNSYIKIGSYHPCDHTVLVNNSNGKDDAHPIKKKVSTTEKGIRDFVTSSKNLLGSKKSNAFYELFLDSNKFKVKSLKAKEQSSVLTKKQK